MQEHNRDPFVNLARSRQLRSRAVFKLEELDRRYKLFHPGQTVVDLGAAPGSWSGYVSEKVSPGGKVIAIDLLEMQPLANVTFFQGDITDPEYLQNCIAELSKFKVDLVISDMAPQFIRYRFCRSGQQPEPGGDGFSVGLFGAAKTRTFSGQAFSGGRQCDLQKSIAGEVRKSYTLQAAGLKSKFQRGIYSGKRL